jgi:hypothetical protein
MEALVQNRQAIWKILQNAARDSWFQNFKFMDPICQLLHSDWAFNMEWKPRDHGLARQIWDGKLPQLTVLNQTIIYQIGQEAKNGHSPGVQNYLAKLLDDNFAKLRTLGTEMIKNTGIRAVIFNDDRIQRAGLFLDRPLARQSEQILKDWFLLTTPSSLKTPGKAKGLYESIWTEDLWMNILRWQSFTAKREMLQALHLDSRPAPSGWLRIFEHQNCFRIACLGLQVHNRHHTEYFFFVVAFEGHLSDYMESLQRLSPDFLESAVESNPVSMIALEDTVLEILHPNDRFKVSVIAMPWSPSKTEFDYVIRGPFVGDMKRSDQGRPANLWGTYDLCFKNLNKRRNVMDSYRDELAEYEKHQFRRVRLDKAIFNELCVPNTEIDDSVLTATLKRMSGLTFLLLLKGYRTKHLKDKNIKLIYQAIGGWTRPCIQKMSFPVQMDLCSCPSGYEQRVWNQYVDYCRNDLLKQAELVRAAAFKPMEKCTFSYQALEVLANRFIDVLSTNEAEWIRYDILQYLTTHIEEFIAQQRRAPHMGPPMDPPASRYAHTF